MPRILPSLINTVALGLGLALACALAAEPLFAQYPPLTPNRTTAIAADNLDPAAFAEQAPQPGDGGKLRPLAGEKREQSPAWVLWTDKTVPGHAGLKFGDNATPGPRHLVIGFKQPVAVGSVFTQAGGRLSVLKPHAAYPGDLAAETDWIPASRVVRNPNASFEVTSAEAADDEFALWTLPPGMQTRALRFTHVAEAADPQYAGYLGAAFVTTERFYNLAPQAQAGADSQAEHADRINNGRDDQFASWANFNERATVFPDAPVVSKEHPHWIMLTWPAPVTPQALVGLGAGFAAAEVQVYTGPADRHPRDALQSDWLTMGTYQDLESGYPCRLWPNRLDLPEPVTTRAIRLRITAPAPAKHPHLVGRVKEGKRIWLSELAVLTKLDEAPLAVQNFPEPEAPHPPIPVRFRLENPGYVTLVIEDTTGRRVRNLIAETPFPAGDNTAWWDGTDDLGRDLDAARHGYYHVPARFVPPGEYRVRGLMRGEITPHFEFSIYAGAPDLAGHPAWETADKSGGWLTNHTPPQAALFVPADKFPPPLRNASSLPLSPGPSPLSPGVILLGSAVSEGGAGLAWVDQTGKKLGGRGWIGGNWTAAPYLARDAGKNADPEVFAYVGSTWTASTNNKDRTHGELRITGLTAGGDKVIVKHPFTPPEGDDDDHHWIDQLGGIAVHDGMIVASMTKLNQLLAVNLRYRSRMELLVPMKSPRGVAFDDQSRLLVLTENKLVQSGANPTDTPLIAEGLEDPRGIALDKEGRIYISDWGNSHQVKVFSAEGKLLRVIGKPGAPKAGTYDPLHMNHPHGLTIDGNGRLWVTENDFVPKRVSVWNPDGTLWKAMYGPAKYGGGGQLDPRDKNILYYADEGRGAMEFRLDWDKGTSELVRVYDRRGADSLIMPDRTAAPETALYQEGRRYFTNSYNTNPTNGAAAFLYVERDDGAGNVIVQPCAGIGRAANWSIFEAENYRLRELPAGANWKNNPPAFFWTDTNEDGNIEPREFVFGPGPGGGVTVMSDLSFCVSRVGDKAMRYRPIGFTAAGMPQYDFSQGEVLLEGVQPPASSGGDQVLVDGERTIVTLGAAPFARQSLSGGTAGKATWSYPSLWPGLHAAHEAPVPRRRGELIGTTRLVGGWISTSQEKFFGVNANMGTVYVFTSDGLFVATLFVDKRLGKPWSMPSPVRDMNLTGFTLGEENFWPTWSQSSDGKVYLMNGAKASLVRLDGFDSVRRLPDQTIAISADDLTAAQNYLVTVEASRQKAQGSGTLEITLVKTAPTVDGRVDEWSSNSWVDIDKTGTAANFNSDSKPYDVTAALAIAGDRLYVAYRTGDPKLLTNTGEVPNAPFKTGGALDLMLATDPQADPNRTVPAPGDLRLCVTQVKGETRAILYRPVVPGTKDPVPFSSPWRTITLDRVDDVSREVQLAGAEGNYEFSIPLSVLGLKPEPGKPLTGDVGILRGDGTQTTARVYWSNKSTGITSDVPSEVMLQPKLWGRIDLK